MDSLALTSHAVSDSVRRSRHTSDGRAKPEADQTRIRGLDDILMSDVATLEQVATEYSRGYHAQLDETTNQIL